MRTKAENAVYMRAWYAANREKAQAIARKSGMKNRAKIMERQRVWNAANRERVAAYSTAYTGRNKERERLRKAAYWKAHPGRKLALVRNRQLAKLKRTPIWADRDAIRAVYERAAAMRAQGLDVHVDHDIPLCGKRVSGLHVAGNLVILSSDANLKKGNRFQANS